MDKSELARKLTEVFSNEKELSIDAIGLAPAYRGLVKDSYVLGVSTASFKELGCDEKMDMVFNILFEKLGRKYHNMIDRVRVYPSKEELIAHKESDFEDMDCEFCESPVNMKAEVFEFA